jgi:structural maintenance of chromosome 4
VIETSGAMSLAGGGSQVSRGGMRSKKKLLHFRHNYFGHTRRIARMLPTDYKRLQLNLQEAEMELERLSIRAPEINMAYQKLGLDIENEEDY